MEVEVCDICEKEIVDLSYDADCKKCNMCGRVMCYKCRAPHMKFGWYCKVCVAPVKGERLREVMDKTIRSYKNKSHNELHDKIDKYIVKKKIEFEASIWGKER